MLCSHKKLNKYMIPLKKKTKISVKTLKLTQTFTEDGHQQTKTNLTHKQFTERMW